MHTVWSIFQRQNRHKYDQVRSSESGDESAARIDQSQEIKTLQNTIWSLKAGMSVLSFAFIVVLIYAGLNHAHHIQDKKAWSVHIGSDPNGFVPPEIGEPPRWTYFSPDSPYYIEEDTFFDFNKTIETILRIKAAHNSSNVLVNRHYANWKRPNGDLAKLPAYFSTISQRQQYIIRGFHQMHCLVSIAEEYGYRYHNKSSQWSPGHVAHCLNAIREAIMCLADATPMSYVNGFAVGHVTDDQQFMCRDWAALKRWSNEPERIIRYKDTAPGAVHEKLTELIPAPELSEAEREGGIDGVGWNGRKVGGDA